MVEYVLCNALLSFYLLIVVTLVRLSLLILKGNLSYLILTINSCFFIQRKESVKEDLMGGCDASSKEAHSIIHKDKEKSKGNVI